MPATATCEWVEYIDWTFDFGAFPPGSRVLDIGFGGGEQMRKLAARDCRPLGLELDAGMALRARQRGLAVCRSSAEALPFADGAFDGVVCKVVVPYTDESRTIREIARVLRPGGTARISCHGSGYFLKYLLRGENLPRRLYGARVFVNTAVYSLTGTRLPGFLGDTLFQSQRRLRRYYEQNGLDVVDTGASVPFRGLPVFIYHVLRKGPAAAAWARDASSAVAIDRG